MVGLTKRLRGALKPHVKPLGWSVASGLIGSAIGLLLATLWVYAMGWH